MIISQSDFKHNFPRQRTCEEDEKQSEAVKEDELKEQDDAKKPDVDIGDDNFEDVVNNDNEVRGC